MRMKHQLVGYDSKTELLSVAVTIPAERFPMAAEIAHVPPDDTEAVGCYPLDSEQARLIAKLTGAHSINSGLMYFMEPVPLSH
ncbi:hypothetical protein JHL17_06105 [Azospirillum sp. YIM B02556]|uniref:DUF7683 domain-containing protein n=1 Tax=Azospirillum endophyticum TaxID=2800326 RepID=A0ABS1F0P2_9PROT|nr:hypothetical protein [Azospirillum endophyticum]MBK1836980.1 hypothetical protein [Azospirillum endophyticum]